jgi:hypothetical protein
MMMSPHPQTLSPRRPVVPLSHLVAPTQRAAALEVKFSRGPAKVLQSTRAPAQLSLFERPYGGR